MSLPDYEHPMQQRVALFHRAFGMPDLIQTPGALPADRVELRLSLIREEGVVELQQAIDQDNTVEIIDALIDTIYVALGALVEMGRDVHILRTTTIGRCAGSPLIDTAAEAAAKIAKHLCALETYLHDGDEDASAAMLSAIAWDAETGIWNAGLLPEPFFAEVQRANMSKLGTDGKPIYSRGLELDGYP